MSTALKEPAVSTIAAEQSRINGALSRGPVTETGIDRSRLNAVTHGLRSAVAVLPDENSDEWDQFLAEVIDDLRPQGAVERKTVVEITESMWRRRRVAAYECAVAEATRQFFEKRAIMSFSGPTSEIAEALAILPSTGHLEKIMRYEAHLSRTISRALERLRQLQNRRKVRLRLTAERTQAIEV